MAAAALLLASATLAEEPISAVLKAKEVAFSYRSSSVFLPCHELQQRVAVILSAVGVREDLKVTATDCDRFSMGQGIDFGHDDRYGRDPFGRSDPFDRVDPFERRRARARGERVRDREQNSFVRIWLMAPVPVTPQVLAEMDKDKSRRELISRVTGNPLAAMNDPIVFAASRQEVTLSRKTIRLDPEDCQLLDEMSRTVFRQLDVRVVRGAVSCNNGRTAIPPQLTVEALLPLGFQLASAPQPAAPSAAPAAPPEEVPAEDAENAAAGSAEAPAAQTVTEDY